MRRPLNEVIKARGSGKVIIGALAALWSAFERHERDHRDAKLTSITLTIATSALVIFAIVLVTYGGRLANVVAAHVGIGVGLVHLWKIVQWPLLLTAMLLGFALVYYFGPNVEEPHWTWVSPGAAAGLIIWLAASLAVRLYLHFFNSYSNTYGSLAGVAILMLWLYVSGFALLLGGEVNSWQLHMPRSRKPSRRNETNSAPRNFRETCRLRK